MKPGGIHLLLVEDNPGDVRLVREMVRGVTDITLDGVDHLAAAEGHLAAGEIDVVLLDLGLPDSQGLDTLARVRVRHPAIPVIVFTGLDDEGIALEAVKAGAQDYLVKGRFDEYSLTRAIRYAVERQRADVALRESEERYRTLFNEMPVGVYRTSADGKILDTNPALAVLLGYGAPAELAGLVVGDFYIEPQEQVRWREAIEREGVLHDSEIRLRRRDGTLLWARDNGRVIRDASGNATSFEGTLADITERKEAERKLRESEERYRLLAENMADTVWLMDMDLRTTYISPSVTRLRGFTLEDVNAIPLEQQMSPESLARAMQLMAETLAKEAPDVSEAPTSATAELEFYRKDGTSFWSENTFVLIRDAQGAPRAILGVGRDITERRQAEEALRRSEAALIEAQTTAKTGSWEYDLAEDKPTWSREMFRIFDRDPALGPLKWKEHRLIIHSDDWDRVDQVLRRAIKGELPYRVEYRIVRRDGSVGWAETVGQVHQMAAGRVTQLSGTVQDITERKQAEGKLAASEAELRALFAAMTDVVIVYDADGRYLKIAPTSPANLYRTQDDMLGKTVHDVLPKEQADYIVAKIGEALQTGQVANGEYALQVGGTQIWFASSASRLSDNTAIWVAHDVTNRKQAEERIQRQVETLGVLYELSRTLSGMDDFGAILDLVTRHAAESAHVTFACVLLLEQDDLVLRAAFPVRLLDQDLQVGQRVPLAANPLFMGLLEENAPRVIQGDSLEGGACAPFYRGVLHSVCIVPLRVRERPYGLLMLCETRHGAREPFTAEKLSLASSIGDQAVSSLQRALLHEETARQLGQLAALHRIDQAIAGSIDMRLTLNVVLEQVTDQLQADAASALLLDPHSHTLDIVAARGFRTGVPKDIHLRLGEGYAGRAALERRLIHVPDLRHRGTDILRSPLVSAEAFVSYYCVPLIAKGQVKGVLEVFHRAGRDDDAAWVNYLETLAGQAAIAIDNSQLFENLQRSSVGLMLAYDATIEGWSHALDMRDKETEGHTQRVTEMTLHMARMSGLSEEELVHVRRGALLHDMGKLGVPDNILLKPGELTEAEWVMMRKHPTFAYEMLSPITYLHPALDIPYCHHEKWDGSGYPRGLKGEQIPKAARIFALVDVFDALRSDRPYRPAWPLAKAVDHIRSLSGSHFDPDLVEPFLADVIAG